MLAPADERGIGCPVNRRVNRNRKRFIFFHPLQDLLLADVFLVGTCDWVTFSFGTGCGAWAWIGLPAQQLRAILRRTGRRLALRWLTRENQNRCAYEQRPSQGKFREILRPDQSWGFCEALEFPSQAELLHIECVFSEPESARAVALSALRHFSLFTNPGASPQARDETAPLALNNASR